MEAQRLEENTEVTAVANNKEKNESLTTELHFELLKQYAWLASALIGGIIVLVQLKVVAVGNDVYIPSILLGVSIFISLMGQDHIVDSLLEGKDIYTIAKILKLMRHASLGCLGMGAGYFAAGILFV